MENENIYIGKRFGLLTVVRQVERPDLKSKHIMWECLCDCGNITDVASTDLKRSVKNKSCGCYKNKLSSQRWFKHGDSGSKLHNIWKGFRKRCNSPNSPGYKNYGARGISVHKDWDKYNDFRKWALENGYQEGLTLERINNDGDYGPSNCKWATWDTQANNRRGNHTLTHNGKTQTISEWAREVGINKTTLRNRVVSAGWSVEDALTRPVNSKKKG